MSETCHLATKAVLERRSLQLEGRHVWSESGYGELLSIVRVCIGLGTIRNDALRDTEISVRLSQRKHDNIRSHFGSSSCLLCIAIVVALA